MAKAKFWGTFQHLGKTIAIVGGDDAVAQARKKYSIVGLVANGAASAPLEIADLDEPEPEHKPTPPAEPKQEHRAFSDSQSKETYDRAASGRFDGSKPQEGAKWAMVRPPAPKAPRLEGDKT